MIKAGQFYFCCLISLYNWKYPAHISWKSSKFTNQQLTSNQLPLALQKTPESLAVIKYLTRKQNRNHCVWRLSSLAPEEGTIRRAVSAGFVGSLVVRSLEMSARFWKALEVNSRCILKLFRLWNCWTTRIFKTLEGTLRWPSLHDGMFEV